MRWKYKNELARKFVHILSILILIIYYYSFKYYDKQTALLILVAILILFLFFEYIRIELKTKPEFMKRIWAYVRRGKEKHRMGGDIFLILGIIISLAIFDFRIAVAVILMTTIGDLSAALIGKKYGKHSFLNLKDRTIEGTTAQFIVDLLIGIFVFIIFSGSSIINWQIWLVILAIAFTATAVETLVYEMDDNLMIPIFAGLIGQIIFYLLNI